MIRHDEHSRLLRLPLNYDSSSETYYHGTEPEAHVKELDGQDADAVIFAARRQNLWLQPSKRAEQKRPDGNRIAWQLVALACATLSAVIAVSAVVSAIAWVRSL